MIEVLGNIGDFVGGIAVVGSLIYLAVQVRSNTKSNQAQALTQWANFSSLTNDHIIRDREFVEIMLRHFPRENWDQTDPDVVRLGLFLIQVCTNLQTIYYLHKSGTIGQEFLDSQIPYIQRVIAMPGPNEWWNESGKDTFTPDFVAFVESNIQEST